MRPPIDVGPADPIAGPFPGQRRHIDPATKHTLVRMIYRYFQDQLGSDRGTNGESVKELLVSPDELAYYRERALIERQRASSSTERRIADIHLELAQLYEKRVELEDLLSAEVRIVTIGHPLENGDGWLSPGLPLTT